MTETSRRTDDGPGRRREFDGPLVSIVTPNLDQGRFLGAAIDSVLRQTYPAIEYRVLDGGSSDGSIEVLRSHGDRVRWSSTPDRGQADAIATGFETAAGEIFGWLNADDVLHPEAVARVVEASSTAPDAGLIYGDGDRINERGATLGPFREIEPFHLWRLIHFQDFILQPAAWFRAAAFRTAGGLDRSLRWGMDWDLWIRLASRSPVLYLPAKLASARIWGATLTATGGWSRLRELGRIARRHAGERWTPGVRLYGLGTLEAWLRRRSPAACHPALARVVRRRAQRIVTGLAAYPDGWLGPSGRILVPGGWRRARIELEAVRLPLGRALGLTIAAGPSAGAALRFDRPGRIGAEFSLPAVPPGSRHEIRVESDFSFTSAQDPRRLAIRVTALEALELAGE